MGVAFKEYDVSRDRAAAEEMVNLTGQMGVPVIVIDGQAVIGFDRARLQELLSADASPKNPVRFGLKIADSSKVAPENGAAPQPGAIIGAVSPGLPGEKAGLQEGDIITGINNIRIDGAADVERTLAGLKPGNIVSILFWRGNEQRKSEIVI
jgi:S1-C subfamily serine protease